jgi:3-hydroxyisobutyrate dehydrogenase
MGLPMAGRLADAGYDVRAWDTSEAARSEFEARAGRPAVAELTAAVRDTSAVVLMLPDSVVVRQVVLEDGLLDALPPAGLVVDMSSSQPTETRALAAETASRGARYVDAPVSGGVRGAEAGTLTIMAGGADSDVTACAPLFEVLGAKTVHAGPVGAGDALKALNNLLSATTLLITCEAVLVARRFGLDPAVVVEAINGSTGRSYSTDVKLPDYVLPQTYDSGFGLRLMAKDLQIALALASATETPLPLGAVTAELWQRAAEELDEDADHTEVARWLESLLEHTD